MPNILLNRYGVVKLGEFGGSFSTAFFADDLKANVGISVLDSPYKTQDDCTALSSIHLSLSFPLEIKPSAGALDSSAQEFHRLLSEGSLGAALRVRMTHCNFFICSDLEQHEWLQAADSGQLVKLVVRTLKTSYNPPSPYHG